METAYCPKHERLERITMAEMIMGSVHRTEARPPEGLTVRVTLQCGSVAHVVTTKERLLRMKRSAAAAGT